MSESDIYVKTALGFEALKQRSAALPGRLRTMLIMVDGVRSVAQLQAAAVSLGAPEDFLLTLQQEGWIEAHSAPAPAASPASAAAAGAAEVALPQSNAERFLAAQRYMNDTAVDGMGFRVFFFSLKLEKCFNADDLRTLLPEFVKHMTKARGEVFAQAASNRVRRLLG
jgi:hypothetical protein